MELFLPLLIFSGFVVVAVFFLEAPSGQVTRQPLNPYERKPFVFDAVSELHVYRILLDLFGSQYYIFPQVPYGRLVQTKRGISLRYRTHFDKKIADFVLCDKERAVAKLVIELDGLSHQAPKRIERDGMVDTMMQQIGLPILHLKTGNLDPNFIKGEVGRALATK